MNNMREGLGTMWCHLMHDSPMWPMHGEYVCRACGRHYPVPWSTMNRRARAASLVLAMAAGAMLVRPAQAADEGPAMAFARYIARQQGVEPWTLETVKIDASIPKLEKTGRLRAVRRLLPLGRPQYQDIEITGDQTVKQQVIVRYLNGERQAAEMPASAVAITPANYKFDFKGSITDSTHVAYLFRITPRQKRAGLIKGELWIDGASGEPIRQSGYLVKKPSIFVKRIEVTRETTLRDGVAAARTTHVSVDTRLVGRAELTIEERPLLDSDSEGESEEDR